MAKFEAQINFFKGSLEQINLVFKADDIDHANKFGREIGKCFIDNETDSFALMVFEKSKGAPEGAPNSRQAEADRGDVTVQLSERRDDPLT